MSVSRCIRRDESKHNWLTGIAHRRRLSPKAEFPIIRLIRPAPKSKKVEISSSPAVFRRVVCPVQGLAVNQVTKDEQC